MPRLKPQDAVRIRRSKASTGEGSALPGLIGTFDPLRAFSLATADIHRRVRKHPSPHLVGSGPSRT
jgi:hypothetical protein